MGSLKDRPLEQSATPTPYPADDTTLHRALTLPPREGVRPYIVAVLSAIAAVLVRAFLEPWLGSDHVFVLSLLAVMFVAWNYGLRPGLVTLAIGMIGFSFFFVPTRFSLYIERTSDIFAVLLSCLCGVLCCMFGEWQVKADRKLKHALSDSVNRRNELEREIQRRTQVEGALLLREGQLVEVNNRYAQAQRQTADALALLDIFFRNAPIGLAFFDSSMRIIRLNEYLARGSQISIEEHIGRDVTETLPQFRGEGADAFLEVLRSQEAIMDLIVTVPRASGPEEVWSLGLYPVHRPGGELLGIGAVCEDVTLRRQEEAAMAERAELATLRAEVGASLAKNDRGRVVLQRCAEHFVDHLDAAYVGVWTLDDDSQTLNLQACAGPSTATSGPLVSVRVGEFLIGGIAEDCRPLLTHNITEGTKLSNPEWAIREGLTSFAGYPLMVEGKVLGVLAVFARKRLSQAVLGDLSPLADTIAQWLSRQRAISALQFAERRFRTLTEAIPQMVWNADPTGRFTYFNACWLEYTALTTDKAKDDSWLKIVHPDDRDRIARDWASGFRDTSRQFNLEFRLRRAVDGEYRWFLSGAVPLRRPDGTIDQWIGSLTDIDAQKRQRETLENLVSERTSELTATAKALRDEIEERQRTEELLRSASRELARSNEELEKFAYIASHDLQEPLRKIQAFGDRLRTKFKDALSETGQDYLERVMSSATRMRQLINDLLTFSRVSTKGIAFTPVNLNSIVHEVLSDLEIRVAQTGASVKVGALPTVDADPSQMRQLFQNLLGNALKFHKPGEAPAITVEASEEVQSHVDGAPRQWVRLSISDQGIGFDEKYVERIFEVFQRLHGREEYEGTGVGLAICRKIVERHSGTITATSARGTGSTFTILLPANQPQAEFIPYAEPE